MLITRTPPPHFFDRYPTPDPIHLKATAEQTGDASQPTTILWNYPPGVPTPDPALLIEVAPERVGTPTTIKWNLGEGVPTPDPALHPANVGTPTTLKWSLTNDVPSPASWGYPPGVPTPDPALLIYGGEETLVWGYPEGVSCL